MERVDVVVVGGGLAGLAAGAAAAAGGVRAILVEADALPRGGQGLQALSRGEMEALGLGSDQAQRVLSLMQVGDRPPVELGGRAVIGAVRGETLHRHLLDRARRSGLELRDRTQARAVTLDPEGWVVELERAEPVRAPILIIADGVRSRILRTLGVATAQHFTPGHAEAVTFLVAHFELNREQLAGFDTYRIAEASGPMSRLELLPGDDGVTLAVGPIWQSIDGDAPWPSPEHPAAQRALRVAIRALGLPAAPRSVELEEWRIGGLPCPATFDGGMVIGAAAGHKPPWPLRASHALVMQGEEAGRAAARAVLEKVWSASALAERLGAGYDLAVAPARAGFVMEAEGLRRRRSLPPEFWRRGRSARATS